LGITGLAKIKVKWDHVTKCYHVIERRNVSYVTDKNANDTF